MIRHNHPGMQIAIPQRTMFDGTADQPRNLRSFQINRSEAGGIEQSVHRGKRLPGGHTFFMEFAAGRQTAIKPERDENGLSDGIDVGQTPL